MTKDKHYKHSIVRVSDLSPYDKNSRTHSDEQVRMIADSISEFGFANPVLIDDNLMIIAGHGRVMAAKLLGIAEVPCVTLSGLSDAQKKAYVIADNKLGESGGWNDEILCSEIADIADMGFDIDVLGFSQKEMSKLFDEMGGVTIDDGLDDVEFDHISVKFPPEKKVEVMNAVSAAISEIVDASIWCGDE